MTTIDFCSVLSSDSAEHGLARAGPDRRPRRPRSRRDPRSPRRRPPVRGATAAPNADYRLVPGDKLRIEVYKDAQLSQSLQVRPDGKITLPLIGDVAAEGRTSIELRDALVTSLKEYNTNPVVTVIVVETVPPVFYVMGEVNAPGSLPLKGQVTVLQALAMAGGFKDFAKTNKIVIQRKGAAGISDAEVQLQRRGQGQGADDLPEARRHDHRSVTRREATEARHEDAMAAAHGDAGDPAGGHGGIRRRAGDVLGIHVLADAGLELHARRDRRGRVRLERRARVGAGRHAPDPVGPAVRRRAVRRSSSSCPRGRSSRPATRATCGATSTSIS